MSALPHPSKEQNDIIDALGNGYNIIVNSVAGSGKTTTSLHVATRYPYMGVLLLTYNARLKEETRDRCKAAHIRNMEVNSYHAMGVRHYQENCFRDTGLREVVENDTPPNSLPHFNIVIIDEAQDMTRLYYSFVSKILRDHYEAHGSHPQILIIGDENQCIFEFNGSDSRYLTLADQLFLQEASPVQWIRLKLSISYRLTANMAIFVNEVMLGRNNIIPNKPAGLPIYYCTGSPFDIQGVLSGEILNLIQSHQAHPEDFFILAPSLKSNRDRQTPVKLLENTLVDAQIPVYVPTTDDQPIQADCARGKVIFSTFHQCKGLERRIVVVFNFDASYFSYFGKDFNPSYCPCPLYVAATRATEIICFVAESAQTDKGNSLQYQGHPPLRFLRHQHMMTLSNTYPPIVRVMQMSRKYVRGTVHYFPHSGFIGEDMHSYTSIQKSIEHLPPEPEVTDDVTPAPAITGDITGDTALAQIIQRICSDMPIAPPDKTSELTATDLTHWLPEPTTTSMKGLLRPLLLQRPAAVPIQLANTVTGIQSRTEYVAEINGLAIPAMLEVCSGTGEECSMYEQLKVMMHTGDMHPAIASRLRALPPPSKSASVSYFLELAAIYLAGASISSRGYISKVLQLTSYDWLTEEQAMLCLDVLRAAVSDNAEATFEVEMADMLKWRETKDVVVMGQVDILTPTVLWEIKCVAALSDDNFLQLAVYAWLWNRTSREKYGTRRFRLLNIITCEIHELQCYDADGDDMLDKIIDQMLVYHFRSNDACTDEEFREATSAVAVRRPNFSVDIRALYTRSDAKLGFVPTSVITTMQLQELEQAAMLGNNFNVRSSPDIPRKKCKFEFIDIIEAPTKTEGPPSYLGCRNMPIEILDDSPTKESL